MIEFKQNYYGGLNLTISKSRETKFVQIIRLIRYFDHNLNIKDPYIYFDWIVHRWLRVTMVINEVLQLYPPVSLMTREALKDLNIGDINVPKDFSLTLRYKHWLAMNWIIEPKYGVDLLVRKL
ncbi:hypothetical protein PTKIN_Ptkin05aG0171000 [Pterospermum kingtungense]